MGENGFRGTPVTIVFTLILSFLGFFAAVTCVTMYYYKRGSGRLERLEQIQQASERRENLTLAARPAIWEVWADKHPKLTSTWDGLLPLNLTYDHDQLSTRTPHLRQSPVPPAPQSRSTRFRSPNGAANPQLRPREPNDGPQSNLATTDCNVSVFIAMPTPYKHPPAEFGGEFAIGTAEVMYRHPDRPNP